MSSWREGEWEARVEPESQAVFYVNHRTKTTSWVPPSELETPASAAVPAFPAASPSRAATHLQEAMIVLYLSKARGHDQSKESKESLLSLRPERAEPVDHERLRMETQSASPRLAVGSTTSLGSSISDRFDPSMLRAEIEQSRRRLAELRASSESAGPSNRGALDAELVELRAALRTARSERSQLLAQLLRSSDPDTPRLESQDLRRRLAELSEQRVELEKADRDAAALVREKEALLGELRRVASEHREARVDQKIAALEADLRHASQDPERRRQAAELEREFTAVAEQLAAVESLSSSDASLPGSIGELRNRLAGAHPGSSDSAVSTGASEESVAGDSGVFEAAEEATVRPTPQLAVSLGFAGGELCLTLHRARHLGRIMGLEPGLSLSVQGLLLPILESDAASEVWSGWAEAGEDPTWAQDFRIPIPLAELRAKVLQLHLWAQAGNVREVTATAQLNFATFEAAPPQWLWLNLLSVQHQSSVAYPPPRLVPPRYRRQSPSARTSCSPAPAYSERRDSSSGCRDGGSSDDSTIVGSQASTLTRGMEPPTEEDGVTSILIPDTPPSPPKDAKAAKEAAFRSSLELELEVQAAKLRLSRQTAQVARLKELKAGPGRLLRQSPNRVHLLRQKYERTPDVAATSIIVNDPDAP